MKKVVKVAFLGVVVVAFASLGISQEKTRTLINGSSYPDQPVIVVSKEIGEQPFIDDSQVLAGQDWLKKLTLGVKNASKKNITAFDIDLVIKKDGKMLTSVSLPINFRTFTKTNSNNAKDNTGEDKLGVLRPGEIVKVRVSDDVMSNFSKILKEYEIENIDKATVDIRTVYFDDGTRWILGR